ncbi:Nucleoid occlusion protein [subsurface metagenome]
MESGKLSHVQVSLIDDHDYRMRAVDEDDALGELVASVRRIGIIVPLLLKRQGERFSVMAGHRRFIVASLVGLLEVPAYVFDADAKIGWDAAFAENLYRRDLSPIEEAAAIDDCLKSGHFNTKSIARALGRSNAWIEDRRELINWPEDVSLAVHLGKLSVSAARNLVRITDALHRSLLVDYAVENGATARTTAAWFQAWQVGVTVTDPGEIEPVEGSPGLPPVVPYTPCVICGRQEEMAHLSYMPVCSSCSDVVVAMAREVRKREVPV